MLCFLRMRGLALLDDVSLELTSGLNVLTGETGAGKSIIVDALALLRGARARLDIIRAGEEQTVVDAQFDLSPILSATVNEELATHGIATTQQELILQRSVPRVDAGVLVETPHH